jgi:hypothetical protein
LTFVQYDYAAHAFSLSKLRARYASQCAGKGWRGGHALSGLSRSGLRQNDERGKIEDIYVSKVSARAAPMLLLNRAIPLMKSRFISLKMMMRAFTPSRRPPSGRWRSARWVVIHRLGSEHVL